MLADAHGHAVPYYPIWMLKVSDSQGSDDPCLCFSAKDKGRALEQLTDGDGVFEFFGVARGDWWIGPGIPEMFSDDTPLAPCASTVTISRVGSKLPIKISADPGQYIDVGVLGQSLPLANCTVKVMLEGCGGILAGLTTDKGVARLGPMKESDCLVSAGGIDDYCQSDWKRLARGVGSITIGLEKGLTLQGMIREQGSGDASIATVMLTNVNDRSQAWWTRTDQYGCFVVNGLPASDYGIAVTTSAGHVGFIERMPVRSNECCDVAVTQGLSISVDYRGEEPCVLSEYRRGVLVSSTRLKPGIQSLSAIPGQLELQIEAAGVAAEKCQIVASQKGNRTIVIYGSQNGRFSFQVR